MYLKVYVCMYVCIYAPVNKTIIRSDTGLLPVWNQAIIWASASKLSIGPLGTTFSEIQIKIQHSFKKANLKMASAKL